MTTPLPEERLTQELAEAKGVAGVCVNAFKALQMFIERKIPEKQFQCIVADSEKDLTRGAEWLNEYFAVAHEQIATGEAEVARLKVELAESQRKARALQIAVEELNTRAKTYVLKGWFLDTRWVDLVTGSVLKAIEAAAKPSAAMQKEASREG